MKIKTSELTGAALDWAVAKCEGYESGCGGVVPYSTDWSQAGPIIERAGINLNFMQFDNPPYWTAHIRYSDTTRFGSFGPTPLVAAMRCYVASRLGDEVDVPEELI